VSGDAAVAHTIGLAMLRSTKAAPGLAWRCFSTTTTPSASWLLRPSELECVREGKRKYHGSKSTPAIPGQDISDRRELSMLDACATRSAIVDFVVRGTRAGGMDFVPPAAPKMVASEPSDRNGASRGKRTFAEAHWPADTNTAARRPGR
jgi:hypothetical protein